MRSSITTKTKTAATGGLVLLALLAAAGSRAAAAARAGADLPLDVDLPAPAAGGDLWAGASAEFRAWGAAHGKPGYACPRERAYRQAVFEANRAFVDASNAAPGRTYELALNAFADLTFAEFSGPRLGVDLANPGTLPPRVRAAVVAAGAPGVGFTPGSAGGKALDWREAGAVTPVKNQGRCGSCWSFSTTGSVEGANAVFSNFTELVSLSEQELVDCDSLRDHGCMGGLMDYAFDFIVKNGGLDTEADYPYHSGTDMHKGLCNAGKMAKHVVSIDGHEDVAPNDEIALMAAVEKGPVSIAIQANQPAFQFYKKGVFDAPCGSSLDHGVLLVGYGSEVVNGTTKDYWLMKNSWGPGWGEDGMMKMAMGIAPHGQCGLAMMASYPLKTSPNPPPPPPTPPSPPPPPPPPKVTCDATAVVPTTCPAETTCCCELEILGTCYLWGCCPLPDATCCPDHISCCPGDTTCNMTAGKCEKKTGEFVSDLRRKLPAEGPLGAAESAFAAAEGAAEGLAEAAEAAVRRRAKATHF